MSRIRSFVLAAMAAAAIAAPASAETLRWGSRADLYSLDPYSVPSTSNLAFLNHIYEGLVRYGPDFKIEPALAESWSQPDDVTYIYAGAGDGVEAR